VIPVRLFTIVWGERFMNWFEHGLVRSLGWPQNKAALKKRVTCWDLWTTPEDEARVREIASRLGIALEVRTILNGKPESVIRKKNLIESLIAEMDYCVGKKSAFFFASPDAVFGDGSVESFMEIGSVPRVCVAAVPMRVVADGFLEALGDAPVSNPRLVKLAFERMHSAFASGQIGLPQTSSFRSGLAWRKIRDGMYAVTFRMHSSYLMQPEWTDVKWFRDKPKFGNYDWSFPQVLVGQQRQRVIGSSDAAFIVELTTGGEDQRTWSSPFPDDPDRFEKDLLHHQVNRNVQCIWRAEG
jgi:hypothetical protein